MCSSGFVQCLDHWQTLAAGLLAIVAAIITVGGTIWVTLRATHQEVAAMTDTTNRQIEATRQAAQMQVEAAMAQVREAQRQTAETKREQIRKEAQERKQAAEALLNSMQFIRLEIDGVLAEVNPVPSTNGYANPGSVFSRISRPIFDLVRLRITALGRDAVLRFIQLERELEKLSDEKRPLITAGVLKDQLRETAQKVDDLLSTARDAVEEADRLLAL